MRKPEAYIEDCCECGEKGWGKAWYGHGEATGDSYGDKNYPTGSFVFCKNCSHLFELRKEYNDEKIWKRASSLEKHNQRRIDEITTKDEKAIGYNQALQDIRKII